MPTESWYSADDVHSMIRDPKILEKHGGKISRVLDAAVRKYIEDLRKPKEETPVEDSGHKTFRIKS